MGIKRFDRIKEIYTQAMLEDILILAANEDEEWEESPEAAKEFGEAFGLEVPEEAPEEAPPVVPPTKAPPTAEEPSAKPEAFTGLTEEEPEEEGEEELSKETPVVMPGTLAYEVGVMHGELGFTAGGKVYEPGATIAKECPRCFYLNRPIYDPLTGNTKIECQNCMRIYKQISQKLESERGRQDYEVTDAIQELRHYLGRTGARPTPAMALQIYNDEGKTTLGNETIRGVKPDSRKILEDAMWYRLNVEKDPETGEPKYSEDGTPIPLKIPAYFTTDQITKPLHLSGERFRLLIDRYNAKLMQTLPPEIYKKIKYDKNGEPLPSSKRLLSQYGWVGPALVIGTGVADIRRIMQRKEPWEELTESEEAISSSPAFKSIDIAAWNWEHTKPAFATWINYLKEKFLPELKKYKLKARRKAMEAIYMRHKRTSTVLRKQIAALWHRRPAGMRVLHYFEQNPDETRDSVYKKWSPELKKYVEKLEKYKPLLKEVETIRSEMDSELLRAKGLLENPEVPPATKKRIKKNIKEDFPHGLEEIKSLQKAEKAASKIKIDVPPEVRVLQYLKSNPSATPETLSAQYGSELESFMEIYTQTEADIVHAEEEAERFKRYRDDLLIKIQKVLAQPSFNLVEELKKFEAEEAGAPLSTNPEVALEEKKIMEKTPPPEPADPETIKASALRIEILNKTIGARASAVKRMLKLAQDDEEEDVWTSALPEEEEPKLEPERPPGMKYFPPKKPEPKLPEPEVGIAGIHEFGLGEFEVRPNEEYRITLSFKDTSGRQKSLSTTGRRLQRPFDEALQDHLGKIGLHNMGVRGVTPKSTYNEDSGSWDRSWLSYEEQLKAGKPPGTIVTAVVTDARNNRQTYYFDIQEGGPIANWYGKEKPTTPRLEREEEIKKEEPKKAPDDDFGNEKGKYRVEFKWNGDYEWSTTSLDKSFNHTPERSRMGFEDLLKRKIELRFSKVLMKAMHSDHPDYPDTTKQKYVTVTVTEPNTREKRVYSMAFDRETGEFDWKSTKLVERAEKRRRLKLPENKNLYNLWVSGHVVLENLVLVDENGLRDVSEPLDPSITGGHVKLKKVRERAPMGENLKEREQRIIGEQSKKFETLPEEEQEYQKSLFEEGHSTRYNALFKNMGLIQGKVSKEPLPPREVPEPSPIEPVEEVVGPEKKAFVVEEWISWRKEVERKDPRTKKPIMKRDLISGELVPEIIQVPMRTPIYSLVTITFYKNGKPKSATCQKVNATPTGETDVGGPRNRPKYKDIWDEVREEFAPKLKGIKAVEREAIYEARKKEYVERSQERHPGLNPWSFGKKVKVSPPATKREIGLKLKSIEDPAERSRARERAGCKGWPFFVEKRLPRDLSKIECFPVRAAVLEAMGEETPEEARIWPYEEIAREPAEETRRSRTERAIEYLVDDKKASRFDQIYKLSLMD